MALKAGRNQQDFVYGFFSATVMERGGVVSVVTAGSGESLDDSTAVAGYAADPSGGTPLGFLMGDTANDDLTRVHENWYKQVTQVGVPVTICNRGWVVTDMVHPDVTVSAPETAYVGVSGLLTNVNNGGNVAVGKFLSNADEDGYVKVSINLP